MRGGGLLSADEFSFKCNMCWTEVSEWCALLRCRHIFCISCAQQHFLAHRSCAVCRAPVSGEQEVKTIDVRSMETTYCKTPSQIVAVVEESMKVFQMQTKLQEQRRKELFSMEQQKMRSENDAMARELAELRSSKQHLTALVESLKQQLQTQQQQHMRREPSPMARLVSPGGGGGGQTPHQQQQRVADSYRPSLFPIGTPAATPLQQQPSQQVLSRFLLAGNSASNSPAPPRVQIPAPAAPSTAVLATIRPNSLMESSQTVQRYRPVTPALQILHSRKLP